MHELEMVGAVRFDGVSAISGGARLFSSLIIEPGVGDHEVF